MAEEELSLEERVEEMPPQVAQFFSFEDGELTEIDWEGIVHIGNGRMYEHEVPVGKRHREKVIEYLRYFGVLTGEDVGNYALLDGDLILNPKLRVSTQFFTSREYAESYRDAKYSKALQPPRIRSFTED